MPTLVLPKTETRALRVPRRRRDVLIMAALLAAALIAPLFVSDGVDRFAPESVERRIAARAYDGARSLNDNPAWRLFLPAARVTRVWRAPGHCAPNEPGGGSAASDYRAEIRFYSFFAIPGPLVHARCGGVAYVW